MPMLRDLDEMKWPFIGYTTATKRSMAIQKMLCTETERETLVQNPCSLLNTKPVVYLLSAISARPTGMDIDENIKSETAVFTMNQLVVFLSSLWVNTIRIIKKFPNKTNKHDERVEDQETDFDCGRYLFIVTVKMVDIVWTHVAEISRKILFFVTVSRAIKGNFNLSTLAYIPTYWYLKQIYAFQTKYYQVSWRSLS